MKHAAETGNATSQSYIAFFYASGYRNVVPADQGKAQLYYSFAANANDRGAQLALGYRYWSGIGSKESCDRALTWYGSAAEQGMSTFRSLLTHTLLIAISHGEIHDWSPWWPNTPSDFNSSL